MSSFIEVQFPVSKVSKESYKEGLWLRKSKSIPLKVLYILANSQQKQEYFSPDSTEEKPKYKSGLKTEKKTELQKLIFNQLPYDEKLNYTDHPER